MPKRNRESEDDYLERKLRKIEKKLRRRRRKTAVLESSSESSTSPSPVPPILTDRDPEVQPIIDLISEPSDSIVVDPSISGGPASENQPEPELADEILSLLGETPTKEKKYGQDIQKDIAIRWEHLCTNGLSKDTKKEIFKNLIPANCKKIEAPLLNLEIKAALTDWLLKKDKALENKQKQIAVAIALLGEALTKIISSEQKDPILIKLIMEAGRIMCDTQHNESLTRRSFICSTLKKELKDQLYDTEIDKFLFGEKLPDTLKAAKAINKSASEMKVPGSYRTLTQKNIPPKNSKNSKPQHPNSRPPAPRRMEPGPPPPPAPAPAFARRKQPPPLPRSQPRAPAPRR